MNSVETAETQPEDILARFDALCRQRPDAPLLTMVDGHGRDTETLTAAQLRSGADAVAGHLRGRYGLAAGDRALMVYTPSVEFVRALVGCLRAGVVPVPVAPPDPARAAHDLPRLCALAASAGARALLGNREYSRVRMLTRMQNGVRGVFRWPQPSWPDLPWITTNGLSADGPSPPPAHHAPDDVALLQYTSGSTSHPKGVMITHRNLAHQIACNARDLSCGPDSVAVFWVPHFHDFGLISGILSAVAGNGHLYMLSPLSFVQRPAVWFEVMSRVRATHTAAPNFAYELAVRKTTAQQRAEWDLSSLQVVMSAAEPVRPETVSGFLKAFAAAQLRPEAFCPAYGLAEHTVGVSVRGRAVARVARESLARSGEGARVRLLPEHAADARLLVGCGRPSAGVRVEVVDEKTRRPLGPGFVGEIWVASPSKARGYYGLPEETRTTFQAALAGEAGPARFLRTGDLGFLHEGELFITGRLKDLIIVRGRNLYPDDIEASVRDCHPRVRPGGVVAFACEAASAGGPLAECLVLFVEVDDHRLSAQAASEVVAAVQQRVAADHRLPATVVLGRAGLVRKTTSGKVQRRACHDAFLADGFSRSERVMQVAASTAADETPRGSTESLMAQVAAPPADAGSDADSDADPRLAGLDDEFRALLAELAAFFRESTAARGGRTFHQRATTLLGTLTVPAAAELSGLPAHAFFAPGRVYPVLVRHANGVQADDAAADNRGATVRILDPAQPDAYGEGLLDLLLTSGECFLAGSASDFAAWMKGGARHREQVARAQPHLAAAAWSQFRRPSSYATLPYYSKVASQYLGQGGGRWLARFRLVPDGVPVDEGLVEPAGLLPPSEGLPRQPEDQRPADFLHQELRARLQHSAVRYRLEAQLRPSRGEDADDEALDATRPWPAAENPFHTCGKLSLSTIADERRIEPLRFNPARAPAELALPLCSSPRRSASLNHLRSLIYELAAERRGGQPLAPPLRALLRRSTPTPAARKRVVVIGAGASGLAAAFALRKLGHEVTVLEREGHVAGKCASLIVDGHAFDWGGHVCTRSYVQVAQLAQAVGAKLEPATPTLLYDLADRAVVERPEAAALREQFLRYRALREQSLATLSQPGFATADASLATPAAQWFERQGLGELGAAIGLHFAACGYGYLADPALPAMYVLRAAETAGMLSTGALPDLPPAWTISGGFQSLWERVAAAIGDVRCGVEVRAVERRPVGVRVHAADGAIDCDAVLLAVPPRTALALLSTPAAPEEPGQPDEDDRALLGCAGGHDYYTTAARVSGLPRLGFYLVRQHCEGRGRPGYSVAFHHRYADSDVVLFYAYGGPGIDGAEVASRLREDVAKMGGALGEVLLQRRWEYFPHAPAPTATRFHAELARWQGKGGVFLLGSACDFELVECNVAYARALVERHFDTAPSASAAAVQQARAPAARLAALMGADVPAAERTRGFSEYLREVLAESLQLGARLPPPEAAFEALGLDSLKFVELFERLATDTGLHLEPVALLDHPTIEALAAHMAERSLGSTAMAAGPAAAAARVVETDAYTQLEDVVFGESHGLALAMDVFVPRAPSGLAVLDVVSAQWESGREVIEDHRRAGTYDAFCRRGFTVFAVRPGSRSRFGVGDTAAHVQRAVRYVRAHANRFAVNAERLGLLGGSAGGHIAALAAMTADDGNPGAADAVARASSRVQALVAFCPATDLRRETLSYSAARLRLLREVVFGIPAADLPDEAAVDLGAAEMSPLLRVPPSPPPTLVLHAVGDQVVPITSSRAFVRALREAGGEAELLERPGDEHRWDGIAEDMPMAAEWLERALRPALPAPLHSSHEAASPAAAGPLGNVTWARWFLVPRPVERPELRLFCFPFAGGTADMYRDWAAYLPGDVELCALSYPGRPPREDESAFTDLAALLDAMERALAPALDRPFAFFGHSLGAIVAFELARQLRRRGGPAPVHLFVSAFSAPQLTRTRDSLGARLREHLLTAGSSLMAPSTRADFETLQGWSYRGEPPLEMPITVFGGRMDPMFRPAELEGWRTQAAGPFTLKLFDGTHRYLQDDMPQVVAAVAESLGRAAGSAPRALRDIDLEDFAKRWRAAPAALTGAWNRFDLCWLARVADTQGRPLFPQALARVLAHSEGAQPSRSAHSYSAFVLALARANTLARWWEQAPGVSAAQVRTAVAQACAAQEGLRAKQAMGWHHFPGFLGRVLVPAHECTALLSKVGALVSDAERASLSAHTGEARLRFGTGAAWSAGDFERYFAEGSLMLHFGEYFPAQAHASPGAREHAGRVRDLPGLTAACAARYLEVTGDARARRALDAALVRPDDGLRPGGRLQEAQFALLYLLGGGVDVRRHFAAEVEYVRATLRADGVGVEEDTPAPDCDGSAVALALCHGLGLPSMMRAESLERFYSEARGSYASADGQHSQAVSTVLHVLQATLAAPDAPQPLRRRVWARAVALLDRDTWVEPHHLSPLYVLEKVLAVMGPGAAEFPDLPSAAPARALERVLEAQQSDGGFAGALGDRATMEETAFGLLALRHTLRAGVEPALLTRTRDAAVRAHGWLSAARAGRATGGPNGEFPDLWAAKLSYAPPHLIEAVVIASLYAPLPS